jgi:predicted ATPase/DNA-binding SARP family transcriptional activator
VRIALLGMLEVDHDGRRLEVSGGRLQALLARLALDAGRPVATATLADAVWEDDVPADEHHALQSLVSRLRRALGDSALVAQAPGGYRLALDRDAVDAHRFEDLARDGGAALRAGDHDRAATVLHDALALWRGPALTGLTGRFATQAAAHLDDLRCTAQLDRIAADMRRTGPSAALVAELERLSAAHPLDERVARQLLQALAQAGRQADALAVYERVRARLDEELGALPSADLQAAHVAVLRGEQDPLPPPTPRANLRAPLTSFVGRAAELDAIASALDEHRLVTLLGPGGVGKTRLAEETAARRLATTPDGVWLVELAPVGDEAEIAQVLLDTLRLREALLIERPAGVPRLDALQRVLDLLADRRALVVLDNCEHLIAGAAAVADEVLARCPGVRIVATSREPLGISGERLFEVSPLAWPRDGATAKRALRHPAVELFADRAAAARPGFAVDDDNTGAVVEICRRLDGLPLALELAAARVRSLSVEQIAQRLDDRFRLLAGGSRTAMPRHRTLRAVVDWSWELLEPAERSLAERLAVFHGGATPESAAAVCGVDAAEVLNRLAALVDRSLIEVVDPDTPRYRMLETIREYGIDRLAERGELAAARAAHAQYFARRVDELEPKLRTADQLGPFAILTAERENALAALRHLSETGDRRRALHLAVSLLWFGMLADHRRDDAIGWIEQALAAEGDADPTDLAIAEALVTVARAEPPRTPDGLPDVEAERGMLGEVLARLYRADATQRPIVALARPALAWFDGDLELADRLLADARRHEDPWIRAAAPLIHAQLGENAGDTDAMRTAVDQALTGFRALGERWGLSTALIQDSGLRLLEGDLDGAAAGMLEARALIDQLGPAPHTALLDLRLADITLRRGDVDAAREHLRRLADEHDLAGEEAMIVQAVHSRIAWIAGDREQARALCDALRQRLAEPPAGPGDRGHGRAIGHAAVGQLLLEEDELDGARDALLRAHAAAVASRDMPIMSVVGLAVSALTERSGRAVDATEMLGAAARLRGGDDRTNRDVVDLEGRLRAALGDAAFEAAYARGRHAEPDVALARLHPDSAPLHPPAVRP